MFYVYIDYTKEEIQRPYYVGKGSQDRVESLKRNIKHDLIMSKFGLDRKIVYETLNEYEAFEEEINLIAKFHTYYYDKLADKEIASNFTPGGDGYAKSNTIPVTLTHITTDEKHEFSSIKEANQFLNVKDLVGRIFLGLRKSNIINNYIVTCSDLEAFNKKKKRKENNKIINGTRIGEFDLNGSLIKEFHSIKELKKELNRNNISFLLKKSSLGVDFRKNNLTLFKFIDSPKLGQKYKEYNKILLSNKFKNRKVSSITREKISKAKSKIVLMISVSNPDKIIKEFSSVKETIKETGFSKSSILYAIHHHTPFKGFYFHYK